MKTKLLSNKMTLVGFMLMTMSINAFANNANEEEKNSVNAVVENSISRSNLDPETPIVLDVGEETDWYALPEQTGYACIGYELVPMSDSDCVTVELSESARSTDNIVYWFFKLIARAEGRVTLKLIYAPVDGGGQTISIEFQIIINW